MIDLDGQADSYDIKTTTENRNIFKPLDGYRKSLFQMRYDKECKSHGSDGIDRVLKGYEQCTFQLTEKEFALNNYEKITLYVDTPLSVKSFIETC